MDIYTYRIGVYVPVSTDDGELKLPDVAGYDVEARDGHIGKVDEATYDAGSSCLVVDTGFWIFGKKRMVPAGVVESIDHAERRIHLNLSKAQVKSAPDFDAERHAADESGYHADVGRHFE